MRPHLILFILAFFVITACTNKTLKQIPHDGNESFNIYKEDFLLRLWQLYPGKAGWAGLHSYDSILNVNSPEYREKLVATLGEIDNNLQSFDLVKLDDANKMDFHLIKNFIDKELWSIKELRDYEWNPSANNIAGRAWSIINGNYADLDTRLKILSALLAKAPSYYQAGINNLKTPTLEHLELGIIQNKGGLKIFDGGLLDSISGSDLSEADKAILIKRIDKSKEAISNYVSTLESIRSELTPESAKSPRVGKEMFFKKFELEINSGYSAEEIYEKALQEKKFLHKQMIVITDTLWDNYLANKKKPADKIEMVSMLINKIAEKHVSRERFFDEINRQITVLAAFVKDKDLLTQDPEKPLVVRETPEYMRGGGAGASISSPGPYEAERDTYYNVTPLDSYTDQQAESYLREYNNYTLQILNIHEAIPGHYTQLVYGNKSPSIIKSILSNGAMVEGWANYSEIMMLEEGYNDSPEMWLMRNKWHLRGVTNTILDYSFHVLGIDKEEAMKLMMEEAFQEQTEAENKWRRVKLSSVQLSSYFTGFTQIYELRNELKAKQGDDFNLKEFHEHFLSYGNAPVKHIRELMMSNSPE